MVVENVQRLLYYDAKDLMTDKFVWNDSEQKVTINPEIM